MSTEAKKGALGFKQDTPAERFFNGLIAENPTLVLMIGMCPTLAVTSSAINGLGMGLATTFVLALSNAVISAFHRCNRILRYTGSASYAGLPSIT